MLAWLGSAESPLPLSQVASCLLALSSHGGDRRNRTEALSFLLINELHHERLHPHDLITPQRPHLQIPLHWGAEFQHMKFGGTHSIHSKTKEIPRNTTKKAKDLYT